MLTAALVITAIAALLPMRMLGWVNDVASIVRLPTVPFTDVGIRLRTWIAGGPQRSNVLSDDVEFLRLELERFRSYAEEWRLRAERLAEENAELQHIGHIDLEGDIRPIFANVVGRNTESDGTVYVLNVGSHRHGVVANSVAVYESAHIVGKIASVSRLQSEMVPLTDPSFPLLRAVIRPDAGSRVAVHLRNEGGGVFMGSAPTDANVQRGDYVYLADPTWPRSAQALIVGTVQSVERDETNPVVSQVRVEPVFRAENLPSVTIKIETAGGADPEALAGGAS